MTKVATTLLDSVFIKFILNCFLLCDDHRAALSKLTDQHR